MHDLLKRASKYKSLKEQGDLELLCLQMLFLSDQFGSTVFTLNLSSDHFILNFEQVSMTT